MKTFHLAFWLHLWQKLFAHSDNLSAALQSSSLSAADSKHLACLTLQVLERMRNASRHSMKQPYERNIQMLALQWHQEDEKHQQGLKPAAARTISLRDRMTFTDKFTSRHLTWSSLPWNYDFNNQADWKVTTTQKFLISESYCASSQWPPNAKPTRRQVTTVSVVELVSSICYHFHSTLASMIT